MPANTDNSNAEGREHHPKNPQETRKLVESPAVLPITSLTHPRVREIVVLGRNELCWTQEDLAGKAELDVKTVQNIENGRTKKSKNIVKLLDLLTRELANGNRPTLEQIFSANQKQNVPRSTQSLSAPSLDQKLLLDHLTGVGFAEWMGDERQQARALQHAVHWLKTHPDDVYVRGMVFWSVLNIGTPKEIVAILKETASWLTTASPVPDEAGFEGCRNAIKNKIDRINREMIGALSFERWHIEDTVARAALFRWLRFKGKSSRLYAELTKLGATMDQHPAMHALFGSVESMARDSWIQTAVEVSKRWTGFERDRGLARLCLVWFVGRGRQFSEILSLIEESSCWLERNPNHTLVRWALLWLLGLCRESREVSAVSAGLVEETARWLETEDAKDDRLVRMGYLWLVGATGTEPQVAKMVTHIERWLKMNPNDDFIRVVYLLFVVRRQLTRYQRKRPLAETRRWLRDHDDPYGLTDLAMQLCESAPDPGHEI